MSKLPTWLKELIKAIAIAIMTAIGTIFATGCSAQNAVIQSSQSSSYVKGDTTVTEVKITYTQTGKIEK